MQALQLAFAKPADRIELKQACDIAMAAMLLVLFSPLLLALYVLVGLDGGPAVFGHERVGFGGRSFRCWKFRSMVPNAREALEALLANDPAAREEWAACRKLRNDPRVTRLGRFLRATSLDELPQLFNVLTGDMSMVGPRPVVRDELETFYGEQGPRLLHLRAARRHRPLAGQRAQRGRLRDPRAA